MSPSLGATLARASDMAAASGASEVTLEHLLAALCDDGDAIAILDASAVDTERLKVQLLAASVGSNEQGSTGYSGLVASQDVKRILEASAAAARGSRRREINGAIVLAAIVGDGRSQAADLLQSNGLTFDSAVRALQSTLAQPAQQERPPLADDVLARARERVQSRAAPSLRDIIKEMPRPAPLPAVAAPAPIVTPPAAPIPSVMPAPAPPVAVADPSPMSSPPQARPPSASPFPHAPPPPTPGKIASSSDAATYAEEPRPGNSDGRQSGEWSSGALPPEQRGGAAPQPMQGPLPAAVPPPPDFLPPLNANLGANRGAAEPPAPMPAAFEPIEPSFAPSVPPPEFKRPQPGPLLPPPIPMPGMSQTGLPHASHSPGARLAPPPGAMPPMAPAYPYPTAAPAPASARAGGGNPAAEAEPRSRKKKKKLAKGDIGILVENVPRTMRVGRTERIEIRIAKGAVKGLTDGMDGGGVAHQHDVALTRAMSVRMRAPEGGFFVESASPETQWIENTLGYASDDYASWRFLVTPQERGWSRLQIVVSARTIGADGVAAESALPDQVVEVKVRANLKRAAGRTLGWMIAAVAGGALSTFGQSALQLAQTLIGKLPPH